MQPTAVGNISLETSTVARGPQKPSEKETRVMWRNRTVCLVGITLALGAGGCIVHEDRHVTNNSGGGAHSAPTGSAGLSVGWDLAYVDGARVDCGSAGTPTVTVVAQQHATGARYSASFPCDDGVGLMNNLPAGAYDVALDLEDEGGRIVSGMDYDSVVAFAGSVTGPGFIQRFPIQAWDMVWTIALQQRNGRNVQVACRDVGASTVRFIAQWETDQAEYYDLPCETYGAITTAIRPGDYQVQMLLLDDVGRTLADTDVVGYPVDMNAPAAFDVDFAL
jgi:hypothetical protein